MDAVLVRHTVEIGDIVEASSTVAVVESMKMETHVVSGTKGRVIAIHASAGDSLKRGEEVEITFANDLPMPAVLNWHGIDGVPTVAPLTARAPLAPGSKEPEKRRLAPTSPSPSPTG